MPPTATARRSSARPAGRDREAVVRAARGTRDRDWILGRYSIDPEGRTTSTAYGRLAVAGGELVWDRLDPPGG